MWRGGGGGEELKRRYKGMRAQVKHVELMTFELWCGVARCLLCSAWEHGKKRREKTLSRILTESHHRRRRRWRYWDCWCLAYVMYTTVQHRRRTLKPYSGRQTSKRKEKKQQNKRGVTYGNIKKGNNKWHHKIFKNILFQTWDSVSGSSVNDTRKTTVMQLSCAGYF